MTNKNILCINGPNLNLLGKRNKEYYGTISYQDLVSKLKEIVSSKKLKISFYQSNHEGQIIDYIQKNINNFQGIIINAGAYSHTSIALRDCLEVFQGLIYEVHLSNIYTREDYRKISYISEISNGIICGSGFFGYELAIEALSIKLEKEKVKNV